MNPQDRSEFWSSAARAGAECLNPEELEALLEGRGDARQQDHLKDCPACAAELGLLSSFVTCEPRPDEVAAVDAIAAKLRSPAPAPAPGRTARARWNFSVPAWAVGLAALVLVAGLAWQVRLWRDPALRVDESGDSSIVRSGGLRILAPSGELKAPPEEINWEPAPGAHRYRVRILEVDDTLVWSAEAETWRVALPPDARAYFVPSKTLRIEVEALDAGGRILRAGSSRAVVKP